MGAKNSRAQASRQEAATQNGEGTATLRAIARGRVYVVINYPPEVEQLEGTRFNEDSYDGLLAELQKVRPLPIFSGLN